MYFCGVENCGKQFRRKDRLLIHFRTHTGERPFRCKEPGCDKSYCRQTHLLRHQQNAHKKLPEEEKVFFQCQEDGCCSLFTQRHNLQKHIQRQHSKDVAHMYKCEVEGCGQTFRKHHQLRAHNFSHTNMDPYKCLHAGCLRTFPTSSRLRRHLKVHQGYQCDVGECGLLFSKWTELRLHKSKDHLEEHTCELCSKTFPKRHLLNNHKRSHHGQRSPLPCPREGCDRQYWDQKNLNAHIRHYHEHQRFSCAFPSCGKTFASKQKLKEHTGTHDPNQPPRVKKTWKDKNKQRKKPGRKKQSVYAKLTGIDNMEVVHDLDRVLLNDQGRDIMPEDASEKVGQKVESRQEDESRRESESESGQVLENHQERKVQTNPADVLKDLCMEHAGIPNGDVYTGNSFISEDATSEKNAEHDSETVGLADSELGGMPEVSVPFMAEVGSVPEIKLDPNPVPYFSVGCIM